jgi:hypothetical protein
MKFREVFKKEKPIMGMIHLAGGDVNDKVFSGYFLVLEIVIYYTERD